MNHRTLLKLDSLFSYISNIIGLICDRFLLIFDLFFWNKIDKIFANLEPDPIFYVLCFLNKIKSQTAKFHGMEATFKFLALAIS